MLPRHTLRAAVIGLRWVSPAGTAGVFTLRHHLIFNGRPVNRVVLHSKNQSHERSRVK